MVHSLQMLISITLLLYRLCLRLAYLPNLLLILLLYDLLQLTHALRDVRTTLPVLLLLCSLFDTLGHLHQHFIQHALAQILP